MLNDRNHKIVESGKWKVESICVLLMLVLLLGVTVPCIPQDKADVPSLTISDNKANLYDIDATGTDIAFVLEALARRSSVNIVVSPEVKGQISAHLKQMSIDSILEFLATVQGFGWKKMDDTYLVAAKEKFALPAPPIIAPVPPEQQVLVWVCKNIKPSDVPVMVERLFPSVKVVEGPEAASPALSATDTGLSNASKTQLSANDSSGKGDKKSNKIVLLGPAPEIAKVKELLSQVDVPRKQVSIEVAIMEIRSSAGKEIGIDWGWNTYSISDTPTKDVFRQADPVTGKVEQQELTTPWTGGIGFGRFLKSPTNLTATISAMIKDGSANLLAKPNISVLDGESGGILIGSKVKYPVLSQRDSDGRPIYDTQEEPVGISLQLSAKVGDEDKVVMALYPQVSMLTGYLNDLPQISTREARTTVAVKSGETLAIGGLISEDEIRNAAKVPLLGDLPIIGNFFKSIKKSKERTEIVIFLTPKIED